jgi:hypothetical protein
MVKENGYLPTGQRREGTFKDDKEDGVSIQTNKDGTKERQIWKDGVQTKLREN